MASQNTFCRRTGKVEIYGNTAEASGDRVAHGGVVGHIATCRTPVIASLLECIEYYCASAAHHNLCTRMGSWDSITYTTPTHCIVICDGRRVVCPKSTLTRRILNSTGRTLMHPHNYWSGWRSSDAFQGSRLADAHFSSIWVFKSIFGRTIEIVFCYCRTN